MTTESAVGEALRKMQRSLTTFFGRKGRAVTEALSVSKAKKAAAKKYSPGRDEKSAGKKRQRKRPQRRSQRKRLQSSARGPEEKRYLSDPKKILAHHIVQEKTVTYLSSTRPPLR